MSNNVYRNWKYQDIKNKIYNALLSDIVNIEPEPIANTPWSL